MSHSESLKSILRQIRSAKQELDSYPPTDYDWYARACDTAKLLVPWLHETAASLKDYVELVLNSNRQVRRLWSDIVRQFESQLPSALVCQLTKQLEHEAILLDYVGVNVVSKVMERHLIADFTNGKLE